MQALVDPVMAAYAKEIGAEAIHARSSRSSSGARQTTPFRRRGKALFLMGPHDEETA
jgi:hypothetical protein